jgi:hypothetical protein
VRQFFVQNRAILRNALRKRNEELPSVSNDMQSSETLRNSLGLNYKSAALNQLSYVGVPPYESCFQRIDQDLVRNGQLAMLDSLHARSYDFPIG